MNIRHLLLAVLTTALWGINFIFIKVALVEISPLWLSAIRFFFAALPIAFFVRRPKVSWRLLFGYGFSIFTLQFSFLFTGMKMGVPAGLASLLLQVQVFFTIGLSLIFLNDKLTVWKAIGALVAFSGIALVGLHTDADVNLGGIVFLLLAALSWATGNVFSKKIGSTQALPLVVWGSVMATLPMLLIALCFEGLTPLLELKQNISTRTLISLLYIIYASTLLGFTFWGFLLSRYSVATIAPFTLLVPIFGFVGSMLFLHEPMPPWKFHASLLVIVGLSLNVFGARIYKSLVNLRSR